MKRNITAKETFAWIVLLCAAFFFSATVAFGQEKINAKESVTTIRIIKKEDGKTTKIDTTITNGDEEAVEKILK